MNNARSAQQGFDSSARDIWVTRWRALVRYKFGPIMSGWVLGLAVSF